MRPKRDGERFEISVQHSLDECRVNAKLLMHEDVPHADDRGPVDLRMGGSDLSRQVICGFADYRDVSQRGVKRHLGDITIRIGEVGTKSLTLPHHLEDVCNTIAR